MSEISPNDRLKMVEKQWLLLQDKLNQLLPQNEEVKKLMNELNNAILSKEINGTETDVINVSNNDFMEIMNEIDKELEIKNNDIKIDDDDNNSSLSRHKDSSRMTFITTPVCFTCMFAFV